MRGFCVCCAGPEMELMEAAFLSPSPGKNLCSGMLMIGILSEKSETRFKRVFIFVAEL